jgi:hydroxymethylpyrimidine pyrophosphatase-like HAD family hydrolase
VWPPIRALALDFDRTLMPTAGGSYRFASRTLTEVRAMGLRVILVSGREYATLARIARHLGTIDAVVAEDGAVVDSPFAGRPKRFGESTGLRVRRRFAGASLRGVEYGQVVVSLPRRSARRAARLVSRLAVTFSFNADRVMIVPRGVNKATGVRRAMKGMRLPPNAFAAIGDGENDLPLLRAAALSGAVRNAVSRLRAVADYTCRAAVGAGVREFVRGPLSERIALRPVRRQRPFAPRGSAGRDGAREGPGNAIREPIR